jgi:hypothetical protein
MPVIKIYDKCLINQVIDLLVILAFYLNIDKVKFILFQISDKDILSKLILSNKMLH